MENYVCDVQYCTFCGNEIKKPSFLLSDSGSESKSCGSKPKSHEVNKSRGDKSKGDKNKNNKNDIFVTTKKSFENNQISFIQKLELHEDDKLKINNLIKDILKSQDITPYLFYSFYVGESGTNYYKVINNKKDILNENLYQYEKLKQLESITIKHLSLDLLNIDKNLYINLLSRINYLRKLNIRLLIEKEHIKLQGKKETIFDKTKTTYIYIYSIYLDWFSSKTITKK